MPELKLDDNTFEPITINIKGKVHRLTTLTKKVMEQLTKMDAGTATYDHVKIFFPDLIPKEIENYDQRWITKIVNFVISTVKKQLEEEKNESEPESKNMPS